MTVSMTRRTHTLWATLSGLTLPWLVVSCGSGDAVGSGDPSTPPPQEMAAAEATQPPAEAHPGNVDARPAPMHQPVPFYEGGRIARQIDAATAREHGYIVVDLGEAWTPYLFTERTNDDEPLVHNEYRETYLALARGEHPDNHHGERAEDDKYLELYGIPPTLGLLRTRFHRTEGLACLASLDFAPLQEFDGFLAYESREEGQNFARRMRTLTTQVNALVTRESVADASALTPEQLSDREERQLAEYRRLLPRSRALVAAQQRLDCEGYFADKGRWVEGGFDWATHEALAEFERRHRIFGWGFLGRETLAMLRRPAIEGEHEDVVRVITERAMHAAGVIEDGSAEGTFRGADGQQHDVPNLEGQIRSLAIEALGLTSPENAVAFLDSLGDLPAEGHHLVAFQGPELPEYYSANMDLNVEIDRGDVWYEFPYDETGHERAQPVERRPHTSIFVDYEGQHIRLARFGTTIGGWRSEQIEGRIWWRYKNSPPGPVVWHQIVAAPVWLPPESTPARDVFRRTGRRGAQAWAANYHETGPSYASAYGLVAAYHSSYREREDGTVRLGGDEGIRSHGSVDYMSIMRRHSHGCHRLHNHIAVRLMSFVLAHRTHTRQGNQQIAFRRTVEIDGRNYNMAIDNGGYVFQLAAPLRVNVLEGRIRGERMQPITEPLPRFDQNVGAYVLPDGGTVSVSRFGALTPVTVTPDAGVAMPGADAGVVP